MNYIKIPSYYQFDPKTHKPFTLTERAKMLYSTSWIATEKVDGTNIRIIWDGTRISFAGRTDKATIPPFLDDYLKILFYADGVEELFEQVFHEKSAIIFGEGYGAKIQPHGELYSLTPQFIVFDIWIDGNWLSRENVEDVAQKLGLQVVPVVCVGTLFDCYRFVYRAPASQINPAHEMEGVVCSTQYPLYDRNGDPIKIKIKIKDIRAYLAATDKKQNHTC